VPGAGEGQPRPSGSAAKSEVGGGAAPAAERGAFGISIFLVLSHVAYYLISRYSGCMHVISRQTLRQFWAQYPDGESALARWFKIMQRHDFTSFETLRATFRGSASRAWSRKFSVASENSM
jgi:hypothetical protein